MAAFSDYLEARLLNAVFRTLATTTIVDGGSTKLVAAVYVGLLTAAPSDSGGGTEVTGGSYARVQVTQADANWNAPGAGSGAASISNVSDITFPTATGSWGTVSHVGIYDASTAGNLIAWAALSANKTVASGDVFKFTGGAPGALVISLD